MEARSVDGGQRVRFRRSAGIAGSGDSAEDETMSIRIVLTATWLAIATPAGAQVVGDALASAGINMTEDEFIAGLSPFLPDEGRVPATPLPVQTSLPKMPIEQPPSYGASPRPVTPSQPRPRAAAPQPETTSPSAPIATPAM